MTATVTATVTATETETTTDFQKRRAIHRDALNTKKDNGSASEEDLKELALLDGETDNPEQTFESDHAVPWTPLYATSGQDTTVGQAVDTSPEEEVFGETDELDAILELVNVGSHYKANKDNSIDLNYKEGTPWREGYELNIVGQGGLYEKEDNQVNVIRGTYSSQVNGDINIEVARDYKMRSDSAVRSTISPAETAAEGESTSSSAESVPGMDKLIVEGEATYYAYTRLLQAHNVLINRVWTGAINRFTGQEGVIISGSYTRVHAGPVVSVVVAHTGDVYGGSLKFSSFRCYIGAFSFHSYDACSRVTGAYIMRCKSWIMPPGSVVDHKQLKTQTVKGKMLKMVASLCPIFEILGGLFMMLMSIPGGIYGGSKWVMGKVKIYLGKSSFHSVRLSEDLRT